MTEKTYPPGALVRVNDICGNPKSGRRGLLPISRNTWYRWVKDGRVPAGLKLAETTTVWRLEDVLALAQPAVA